MIAIANRNKDSNNTEPGQVRRLQGRAAPDTSLQRANGADPRTEFSAAEWEQMVATSAYYRAQARGFEEGCADDDWFQAEAELRERFSAAGGDVEKEAG